MSDTDETDGRRNLSSLARTALIGIDDLSDVRHLHVSAFNAIGGSIYTEEEVQAFHQHVNSNTYIDRILAAHAVGAWIEDRLVGTSSWCPVGDDRITARIADLFVDPLFGRQGLGEMLLRHAEEGALAAGFSSFVVRVGYHAVGAFEAAGYNLTSQGIYQLTDDVPLAVVFMRKGLT